MDTLGILIRVRYIMFWIGIRKKYFEHDISFFASIHASRHAWCSCSQDRRALDIECSRSLRHKLSTFTDANEESSVRSDEGGIPPSR